MTKLTQDQFELMKKLMEVFVQHGLNGASKLSLSMLDKPQTERLEALVNFGTDYTFGVVSMMPQEPKDAMLQFLMHEALARYCSISALETLKAKNKK